MNFLIIFLLVSLLKEINKIKTFYAEFTQTISTDTTIGRIYFKRPNKMRVELIYPESILIICDAGKFVQITVDDTNISEGGPNNPIEFFLNVNKFKVEKLDKNWYKISLNSDLYALLEVIEKRPIPIIQTIKFGELVIRFKNVKYNAKQDINLYKVGVQK